MTLREQINTLGENGTPFLFCIDYKAKNGFAYPLDKIPHEISYSFGKNIQHTIYKVPAITDKNPITKEIYKQKIEAVKNRIKNGDIYMANLTAITDIELNCELEEIFSASKAPYRLLVKDKFVVSSPEAFINIKNGKIYTYPMKGTAVYKGKQSIDDILKDGKELSEHTMTVDLLRNDLSIIADRVTVKKFRYPIIAKAGNKELIQIVSEIVGDLRDGYKKKLGDILFSLLPAGSITGTPKKKCLEVLEQIEGFERGYFCGVFGIFDGEELQSAVSIRFIEKTENGYIYKSGGGITLDSDWEREYDEMVEKVYIAL